MTKPIDYAQIVDQLKGYLPRSSGHSSPEPSNFSRAWSTRSRNEVTQPQINIPPHVIDQLRDPEAPKNIANKMRKKGWTYDQAITIFTALHQANPRFPIPANTLREIWKGECGEPAPQKINPTSPSQPLAKNASHFKKLEGPFAPGSIEDATQELMRCMDTIAKTEDKYFHGTYQAPLSVPAAMYLIQVGGHDAKAAIELCGTEAVHLGHIIKGFANYIARIPVNLTPVSEPDHYLLTLETPARTEDLYKAVTKHATPLSSINIAARRIDYLVRKVPDATVLPMVTATLAGNVNGNVKLTIPLPKEPWEIFKRGRQQHAKLLDCFLHGIEGKGEFVLPADDLCSPNGASAEWCAPTRDGNYMLQSLIQLTGQASTQYTAVQNPNSRY